MLGRSDPAKFQKSFGVARFCSIFRPGPKTPPHSLGAHRRICMLQYICRENTKFHSCNSHHCPAVILSQFHQSPILEPSCQTIELSWTVLSFWWFLYPPVRGNGEVTISFYDFPSVFKPPLSSGIFQPAMCIPRKISGPRAPFQPHFDPAQRHHGRRIQWCPDDFQVSNFSIWELL